MQPNKLDIQSTDITAENLTKLQELFPSAIKEGKVDVDALRNLFGDIVEPNQEYYNFTWAGKSDCFKIIKEQTTATLKPVKEESVNFDETENIFIEGDNLEVLKTLQKTYHGKVKMIYIDPPYNKDKDFVYPDRWSEGLADYLEYAKLVDEEGNITSSDAESEAVKQGRKHSRWLSMMYPRLFLAKNLLREDGVIFISIDDDEVKNLRNICDEIFGEENFIESVVWQKRTAPDMRTTFSNAHEYVLIYGKTEKSSLTLNKLALTDEQKGKYKNPDNDPKGPWVSSDFTARGVRPNQLYAITAPNGKIHYPPEGKCWQNVEDVFLKQFHEGRFYFGANGDSVPRRKNYLNETDGRIPWTWWTNQEVGHSQEGKVEVNEIFQKAEVFSTPKPVRLIQRMVHIATEEDSIVLDFFAGSSATAHAVMLKNVEDNGNRVCISVQLPEITDNDTPAFKEGYRTVAEISKERIRRAGSKVAVENPDVDTSFKVFKLDSSNFLQWEQDIQDKETLQAQFDLYGDNVKEGADSLDMLYEVIIKKGLSLNSKIAEIKVGSKTMYQVDSEGVELLACFEMEVTKDDIDAVLEANPIYFICLDKAFEGNDQLKTNATLGFKDAEILFETV